MRLSQTLQARLVVVGVLLVGGLGGWVAYQQQQQQGGQQGSRGPL